MADLAVVAAFMADAVVTCVNDAVLDDVAVGAGLMVGVVGVVAILAVVMKLWTVESETSSENQMIFDAR